MRIRLLVCVVLVALWGSYAQWGAGDVEAIPLPALQNAIVAERVRDAVGGEAWLVGSSMIGQLPVTVIGDDVRSAALSGDGAASALALLEHAARPRAIVVETNRLLAGDDRGYATMLWYEAAQARYLGVRATRLANRPSTRAVVQAARAAAWWRRRESAASRARRETALAAQWGETMPLDARVAADTAAAVRARLDRWRARGVRVWLIELPVHASVAARSAETVRRAALDAALPIELFPRITVGAGPWRTTDGRHLEPDDARRIAHAIADALGPAR
jgi:hypothetical protein